MPIHDLLRGPLRDWAEDLLAPERLAGDGHFDPAPMSRARDQHRQKHQLLHWSGLSWHDDARSHVSLNHFLYQFRETDAVLPAELFPGFAWIT